MATACEAVSITLDVDWAPDFAIDAAAGLLAERSVPATWFVTHPSPAVDRLLERPDIFEVGLHPNLLPGSTHGETVAEVAEYLLAFVPEPRSMRTHSLLQSSRLLDDLATATGVTADVSLYLPYAPHLQPIGYRSAAARLVRLPYFWEDDDEMFQDEPRWEPRPLVERIPGLKIFDFHPVHVFLNSSSPDAYRALCERSPQLLDADRADTEGLVETGPGIGSFFTGLVDLLAERGGARQIADIADEWARRQLRVVPA